MMRVEQISIYVCVGVVLIGKNTTDELELNGFVRVSYLVSVGTQNSLLASDRIWFRVGRVLVTCFSFVSTQG